jgi:hypothetical protein
LCAADRLDLLSGAGLAKESLLGGENSVAAKKYFCSSERRHSKRLPQGLYFNNFINRIHPGQVLLQFRLNATANAVRRQGISPGPQSPGDLQMAKVRLNIEVSQELADLLDNLAETENATRSEIVRRAIAVLKAYKQQRESSRPHLGFAKDPQRLDVEIVGILNSAVPTAAAPLAGPIASAFLAPASAPEHRKPTAASETAPVSLEAVMSRWSPHSVTS